jgi:hypothetical protein
MKNNDLRFKKIYTSMYANVRRLPEILKLGDWRFFFLRDMNYLDQEYIVDGDLKKLVRAKHI